MQVLYWEAPSNMFENEKSMGFYINTYSGTRTNHSAGIWAERYISLTVR